MCCNCCLCSNVVLKLMTDQMETALCMLDIPQDVNVLVGHQYYKTDMEFLIERQRRGSP